MSSDQILPLLGILGAVGTALAALVGLWKVVRALWSALRRVSHFFDDWFGEDARDGREARPSIPERIASVEKLTAQLEPNGGSHLRDQVARMEDQLGEIASQLTDNTQRLARIEQRKGWTRSV